MEILDGLNERQKEALKAFMEASGEAYEDHKEEKNHKDKKNKKGFMDKIFGE